MRLFKGPDGTFPPLAKVQDIKDRFEEKLPKGPPGEDLHDLWLEQLAQLMVRIVTLRNRQNRRLGNARRGARLAASVTAVVTALTGGTLLAGVHGAAATALGVAAVALGIGGAALNAIQPAESYATSVLLAAKFERLWWAIYSYCSTELRRAEESDFDKAWTSFTDQVRDISSTLDRGIAPLGSRSAP